MNGVVVDTNVPVVANGKSEAVDAVCQLRCVRFLRSVIEHGLVHIDNRGIILAQYRKHLRFKGEPGVGDAFYRRLNDQIGNHHVVSVVPVTPTDDEWHFAEFPRDERLLTFDPDDRVFVAVSRASAGRAEITNAVDSDWDDAQAVLLEHGVVIKQLCPDRCRRV
jgi:hypothetical protein